MFRFKVITGEAFKARHDDNQITEAKIRVNILNTFAHLAMPQTTIGMM